MDHVRIYALRPSPEELEKFQAFFMQASGLVFEGRRLQEMERAIAQRMIELGITSFGSYYDLLRQPAGREELNQLVLSLTVGETHFFRTPDQFAALRKYVFPELIERLRPGGRRLSILSAGCATGEEPYTLYIMLCELIPDLASWKLTIRGCDINREFLEQAREGIYGERKVKFVDPLTRARFFDRLSKNRWQVKEEVRNAADLIHFNITVDDYSPLTGGEKFDLILCRNVLIYFNLQTVKEVIRKLYRALAPEGYLMLGYSETLFKISDAFQAIHTPEAYFYQKTEAPVPARALPERPAPVEREEFLSAMGSRPHPLVTAASRIAPEPPLAAEPAPAASRPARVSEDDLWQRGLAFFAEERFAEAGQMFEQMLTGNQRSARAHLGLGLLYANSGADDRSRHHVEEAKRHDDLMPEIYFLQALLDEKNDDFARAVENYQRVILLHPDFAMAHFNLANLFLKLSRPRDARREFENTMNILDRDPQNRSLHFSGGLSRDSIMEFCRMQLQDAGRLLRRAKGR